MSEEHRQGRVRIALEEAKQLYDRGDVTILDVVDSESYTELSYKIEGAVRIKPENIKDQYTQLPKDQRVLAY
ncbi:MAG: rhodanese-like domain-containing protein [Anaerolineales bacterium]